MTREQLRLVIRELLAEQLAALDHGGPKASEPGVHEELVSIASDADLNAFAGRVLTLADDEQGRRALESGRHVFRLAKGSAPGGVSTTAAAGPMRVERGLISEKTVAKLPEGVRVIQAGKQVRITPLAQDELRRRGVTIERTKR